MALGQNLKILRKARKLTQGALSQLTNGRVSQAVISALEQRDSATSEHAPALAEAMGVSLEDLLVGKDINLRALPYISEEELTRDDDIVVIIQYHDVYGAMGKGVILRDQPGQITAWKVTNEWIIKNIPNNTGALNLCIVTGFGDSMRGMYNSGDPLIVDTGIKEMLFDGVYFFRIGDEGFIKRLQRIPGDGIRAISENKAYESWTITPDMDFEIFGRVVKVWKSWDL